MRKDGQGPVAPQPNPTSPSLQPSPPFRPPPHPHPPSPPPPPSPPFPPPPDARPSASPASVPERVQRLLDRGDAAIGALAFGEALRGGERLRENAARGGRVGAAQLDVGAR